MPDLVSESGKCWNGFGDVQEVTDEQAKKLLVHDDEFAIAQPGETSAADANQDQPNSQGEVVEVGSFTVDSINALGKIELLNLANEHSINVNANAPVVAIRKQLIAALIK